MQIIINNKPYEICCNPGEEDQLQHVANILQSKVGTLKTALPYITHELLLVIIALTLQDELLDKEKASIGPNDEIADALDSISSYIEQLSASIKQ